MFDGDSVPFCKFQNFEFSPLFKFDDASRTLDTVIYKNKIKKRIWLRNGYIIRIHLKICSD
jgi:hypothetical protein